jgi:hypothetical protein
MLLANGKHLPGSLAILQRASRIMAKIGNVAMSNMWREMACSISEHQNGVFKINSVKR